MPLSSLRSSSCLCICVLPRLLVTMLYSVSLPDRVLYLYSFISDVSFMMSPQPPIAASTTSTSTTTSTTTHYNNNNYFYDNRRRRHHHLYHQHFINNNVFYPKTQLTPTSTSTSSTTTTATTAPPPPFSCARPSSCLCSPLSTRDTVSVPEDGRKLARVGLLTSVSSRQSPESVEEQGRHGLLVVVPPSTARP